MVAALNAISNIHSSDDGLSINFSGYHISSKATKQMAHVLLWSTDVALAEVEKEKRLSYVKAWEESEKSKSENK